MIRTGAEESLLDEDNAAFIQGGVSIIAASRTDANVPTLAQAVGCRVSPDRRQVTVFLARFQSGALFDAVDATGAIAVVFSQPSGCRTLQVKGADAVVVPLESRDKDRIRHYITLYAAEIAALGFDEMFARTMLACEPADLSAVTFTPSSTFGQTPGPGAGAPLAAS
jgi:hypothetical protein